MKRPEHDDLLVLGGRLLGARVDAATAVGRGGNNRVFRLDAATGTRFALKFYPSQAEDPRDRLGQELAALGFLARAGIHTVPRPVAADRNANCALYTWLDGLPASLPAQDGDVEALALFLARLQPLRGAEGAHTLPDASASIFSPAEAIAQLEGRLARLNQEAPKHPALGDFLRDGLRPATERVVTGLRTAYERARLDPRTTLPRSHQALSPSDFGLHNVLRGTDGRLSFLDFEYFGWDDPAKMLCDAMLHPGSDLSRAQQRRLHTALVPVFADQDPSFALRISLLYPLLGLIWCLIILNEFLPERWQRRVLAGTEEAAATAQSRQLTKARGFLSAVMDAEHDFAPG